MKKVYIIGAGIGNKCFMHKKAAEMIEAVDCLIGAKRMLRDLNDLNKEKIECIDAEKIYSFINSNDMYSSFGVLVSGDTGFFSLSGRLTELLSENGGISVENIPAVGSLQYFCSKLNIPWDSIKFASAHGRNADIIPIIMFNKKVFLLTGGELTPDKICLHLTKKGLGHLKVSVGEKLSYDDERITEDYASIMAERRFDSLSVMMIHNDNALEPDAGNRSIRDDEFITGSAPMTKSEVRTISIAKLNIKSNYVVFDIGAGTGSVSIETALKLYNGTLYAIEKEKKSLELIKSNIEKFNAHNIELIEGAAPSALFDLPKPDAVFIGGSGGYMDDIISEVIKKNPFVTVVINTITLQSLNEALNCMEKYKFNDMEIINLSVSKAKKIGHYDMMIGQNPIYIISGKGSGIN